MGERFDPFPTPPLHIFGNLFSQHNFTLLTKSVLISPREEKRKREGTKQSLELEACFCWKYIDSDVCLDWYCEWCYIMSWAGWGRCPYILASLHTTSDGGDDGGPAE